MSESFLERLSIAARDNPLAATLIGGGALWLLTGSGNLKRASGVSLDIAAEPLADRVARNTRAGSVHEPSPGDRPFSGDKSDERKNGIFEKAADGMPATFTGATSSMRSAAAEGLARAKDRFGELPNPVPVAKDGFDRFRSTVSGILEDQPLVLGIFGIAVGAALGNAFRNTALENDWAGELSDGVKSDIKERAAAVSQSLREGADTLKAEVGDAAAESFDRLHQAGKDAIDAARDSNRGKKRSD